MVRAWGWAAVTILLASVVSAAAPVIHIRRVDRPPALEDYLRPDPPPGPAVSGFIQREPTEGAPESQATSVYLFFDDENLYIIFHCRDREPQKVRARLSRREDFVEDDFVSVRLDTFYDRRRAFMFSSNPLGVQMDALHDESQGINESFDTLWYSRGQLAPWGYAVRMAIPWKSLRFPPAQRQTWGILFTRRIPRNNEFSYWPQVSRTVAGFLTQGAELQGLEEISPGKNVQLIPYGSLLSSRFADFRRREFIRETAAADGGLDAKFVLRDSLALDVTLNPDFSQVESDEPQVTVNQRFEVFFPEKRPFFLENANFFQTPVQVFFTRRIADPQFGVRLTGKQGPYAIGALLTDDQAPGRTLDPALAGRRAGFAVVRVNRDIAKESTLGGIFTERKFAEGVNRVAGIDTRVKLPHQFFFTGQALVSHTRATLAGSAGRTAPAFYATLDHFGRHWTFVNTYTDFAPEFRAQAGFVPRVDLRRSFGYTAYHVRPAKRRLVRWTPGFGYEVIWNHAGLRTDYFYRPDMTWEWRGQTVLFVGYVKARERLCQDAAGACPDFNRSGFLYTFRTSANKRITFTSFARVGRSPVYQPAPGLQQFQADLATTENGISLRPVPRLRLDHSVLLTRLAAGGAPVFTNAIFRQKVNFQFSRELSLRTIVQYESTMPNASLSGLARTKRFAGDVLLSYVLNPGTALYVGYAHHLQNVDAALGRDPAVPFRTGALFPTGRQFFAKLSYLYRF